MITNPSQSDDVWLNERFLNPEAIALTSDQLDWARQCSQLGQTETEQWQIYLQALALRGVQEWFQKRAPQLSFQSLGQTGENWIAPALLDSPPTSLVLRLGQVQVGAFRVHLLVTDAMENREIAIPREIVSVEAMTSIEASPAENNAQFYLLVEVLEEMDQVTVGGYLRRDQLLQTVQTTSQALASEMPTREEDYWLSIEAFQSSSDRLLLELQLLDPAAIPQVIPEQERIPSLSQRVINAGLWLRDQLDQVAAELSWALLPPPEFSPALRSTLSTQSGSSLEQFNRVLQTLNEQQGIHLPPQARAAYTSLPGGYCFYAIAWEIEPLATQPEWVLMPLLIAPSGMALPANTRLQVWEDQAILIEQQLEDAIEGGYLFAQVVGGQDEQFTVRLLIGNQETVQFPPFGFQKYSGQSA